MTSRRSHHRRTVRRDWVVFDTNAVRGLAALDARRWERFVAAWNGAGLRTAWAPPVIVEIAGTNLARKKGLDPAGLSDVQAAVRRFDELARGEIEPDADELVRRSLYDLAGVAAPPSPVPNYSDAWRGILTLLLAARSPREVQTRVEGGALTVRVVPQGAKSGWDIVVPPGFEEFVRTRIAGTVSRVSKPRAGDALERDVASTLPKWGAVLGKRLAVPPTVVAAALDPAHGDRLFRSPFAMRAVCEITYDHDRLPGRRTKVDDPNDQLDLALTTYLYDNRSFVTNDRRFGKLLLRVLADPARIVATPIDLLTEMLAAS